MWRGTHRFNYPAFPLLGYSMSIGVYAWISARASFAPGTQIGAGAVLEPASVATSDLEPWSVYARAPAVQIKARTDIYPRTSLTGIGKPA